MRIVARRIFAASACIAVVAGGIYWVARANRAERSQPGAGSQRPVSRVALETPYPGPGLTTFPDPTAPPGSSSQVFIDRQSFDGLVASVTAQFTDKVRDESSLDE